MTTPTNNQGAAAPAWANPQSTAAPAWANPSAAAAPQQPSSSSAAVPAQTVEEMEAELFNTKYSTLDEPVSETIMRDVRAVGSKLKIVLMPLDRNVPISPYSLVSTTSTTAENDAVEPQDEPELSANDKMVIQSLKDWDLWGPLVLCLGLAVILSFKAPKDQSSLVFAAVFCAVWAGGTVVTINAQLLGGTISFFQSLCVLGYSIFPLTLAAMVIGILKIFVNTWWWVDLLIVVPGFVWSIRVSTVFISLYIRRERRFLALYPVFFFYIFLSWMILLF